MHTRLIKTLYIISAILIFVSLLGKGLAIIYGTLPKFHKVQSVRILRVENNTAYISLIVEIENRSIVPFSITNSDLSLYDSNKKLGLINIQNNVLVHSNSSSIIKFQLALTKDQILQFVQNNTDSLFLEVQGSCDLKMMGINKTVKISQPMTIYVEKMMDEYIFRVFQNAIFNQNANINRLTTPKSLSIPITLRNESGFDVTITNIQSKVFMNKITAGSGNISSAIELPNNMKNYQTTLLFSLNDLESLSYSSTTIERHRIQYSVDCLMEVSLWNRIYPVLVELNGEIIDK